MGSNTKIQWAHHTFNPWRGCAKVAAGCVNCYAEAQSKRNPKTLGLWGPNGTRVVASESMWREPLKWNKPAACCCRAELSDYAHESGCPQIDRPRVFCGSLCDVFEDWPGRPTFAPEKIDGEEVSPVAWYGPVKTSAGIVDQVCRAGQMLGSGVGSSFHVWAERYRSATLEDVRARLFSLIDSTPSLDWLLLTKRPENVRRMWPNVVVAPTAPLGEEEWREIPGHEPYFASSHGRIRGPRGIIAGDTNDTGHRRVTLHGSRGRHREQSYRLVLLAFVGPPPSPSAEARHLDGDATNNCLTNLAWGSQSDNWDDSKRHGTHRRYSKLTTDHVRQIRERYANGESFASIARDFSVSSTQIGNVCKGEQWNTKPARWNCWLGTSIACQEDADKNIPELLKCRKLAAKLFLSIEPLIGEVNLRRFFAHSFRCASYCGQRRGFDESARPCDCGRPRIDWVIVGGESGPKARPCDIAWIRSIVRQCQEAGVPVFVKQLGAFVIDDNSDCDCGTPSNGWPPTTCGVTCTEGLKIRIRDTKGGDPAEWPEDVRVREVP